MKAVLALAFLALIASALAAPSPKGDVECVACEFIVTELEKLLASNSTVSEIEAALDKACSVLPASLSGICSTVVNNYLPQLIAALENKEDPSQVCSSVGLCSSATPAHAAASPKPASDVECVACEFIVTELEKLLASNSTVSEIEAALDKACSVLPASLSGVCQSLINNYLPELIAALENKEDPSQVCTSVGLCSSATQAATPAVSKPESDCSICELIVSELYSLLQNNATESEIIDGLNALCAFLPSSDQAICDNIVQNYVPQLIQLLENDVSPQDACTDIGLCSSAALPASPQDDCSVCELIAGEVESLLASNATESEIESALEKICSVLPGAISGLCNNIVSNYLPQIIDEINNDLPPNVICQKLGFCSSAIAAAAAPLAPQSDCTVCELVVGEIETLLASNKSESEIITLIEKLCAVLPGSLAGACDSLVEADIPTIIAHLEADNPPSAVCTKLGKCTSAPRAAARPADAEICQVCELVVAEAEKLITGKNLNETQIVDELKHLCTLLPANIQTECSLVVTVFAPEIISELENGTPAATVCTNLKLCTSSRGNARKASIRAL